MTLIIGMIVVAFIVLFFSRLATHQGTEDDSSDTHGTYNYDKPGQSAVDLKHDAQDRLADIAYDNEGLGPEYDTSYDD